MTLHGEANPPGGVLLYKGAEADVVRAPWCGRDAVYKLRRPLPYRLPILDNEIRKQRTVHEAEMIHAAKRAGVMTPYLYFVDPTNATLVMEFIVGARVKDLVGSASRSQVESVFEILGADVARLHSAGIMHGDLTTANIVKQERGMIYLDFGLSLHSTKVEDHAVDLRLMKETIVGAHSAISVPALESLFAGYARVAGAARAKAVFKQLHAIERRGRYARVD